MLIGGHLGTAEHTLHVVLDGPATASGVALSGKMISLGGEFGFGFEFEVLEEDSQAASP